MAEAELIDVRWTNVILDETQKALTDRLGVEPDKARTLCDAIQSVDPDATVEGFEHLIAEIDLPDPDDRHVVAAALACEADIVVTFNTKDFERLERTREPGQRACRSMHDYTERALLMSAR